MRGRDVEMDYEYLGRYVFNCHGKGCDPFNIANADISGRYFNGSAKGKANMSIIISRLIFEAQQQGKVDLIKPVMTLYQEIWDLEDNSSKNEHDIAEPLRIMYELMDLAKTIIGRHSIHL